MYAPVRRFTNRLKLNIVSVTNVTCFDGSNGSITVVASGGESPYIYSQDPSFETYNSTGVFDNLSITGPITEGADEYGGIITCTKTFYVKDANNVISSVDVELSSPVESEWLGEQNFNIIVYCDAGQNYATITPGVTFAIPRLSTNANNPTISRTIAEGTTSIGNFTDDTPFTLDAGQYTITYQLKKTCYQNKLNKVFKFTITVLPNNE